MDNINDLVGDAAKQLMAQADGIQNPRLKESAKRVALTVSAKTRDETITKARNAAFARIPIWAFFLPVTRRQQIVLGRIYSFQCTTNKDGSPAEYRMSLSTGASELGMTNRAEMQKDLQRLISLGFVTKRSNGARKAPRRRCCPRAGGSARLVRCSSRVNVAVGDYGGGVVPHSGST